MAVQMRWELKREKKEQFLETMLVTGTLRTSGFNNSRKVIKFITIFASFIYYVCVTNENVYYLGHS